MKKYFYILILFCSANVFAQVVSLATLKAEFDAQATDDPRVLSISLSGDGGDLYYLDVSPYVHMFQATGQDSYMDYAMMLFDNAMNSAVSVTGGYLGWPDGSVGDITNGVGVNTGIEVSLAEGRGFRTVARMLWVLEGSPTYLAKGTNQADYDAMLSWFQTNVWDKWESRGIGHFYRSRIHMASHWGQVAWFLHQITGTQKYRDVYENMSYAGFPVSSAYPGANMRYQLRETALTGGNGYIWSSSWGDITGITNDVSHANAEMELMVLGAEMGDYWTAADMVKFVRTMDQLIYKNDTYQNQAYRVDGSGTDVAKWDQGFIQLGRFDSNLQNKLTGVAYLPTYYYYQKARIGNLAYNRAYLDSGLFYPESPSTDTTAPSVTSTFVSVDESNRFKVQTQLDEFANYKIDYGTATGVYTESTTEELTFNYSLHRQWVGGNNAPLLTPGVQIFYRFDMEDASANQAFSTEYTYTPASNSIPQIVVTGNDIVDLEQGETYTELGAVWTDVEDGTGAATVGGDTVNTSIIGSYVVNYDYTDTDTNAAETKTRTVNISSIGIERVGVFAFGIGGGASNNANFYLGSTKYRL